jgi:hypothetical protein
MEKAALNFLDLCSRMLFANTSAAHLNNLELEITIKDSSDILGD